MELIFRTLSEEGPGHAWQKVFRGGWPGWRAWLQARQDTDAPSLAESERALRRHMPEFVSVWETLVERVDADDEAARFLTFWSPPRYLGQCAQAVSQGTLVRNYDLDPRLNEATLLKSAWTGRPVMGMVEGIAGLADGINADGLAVSLAYGGRKVVGEGFGIPLVVRYLLEVCGDVGEAVETLRRLPHHMSYNLTLLDCAGRHATVQLAPDREIIVNDVRFATNHQVAVEDERHAAFCNTVGRADHLDKLLTAQPDGDRLINAFQEKPLFNTQFEAGFGTVYTASYRPEHGEVALIWPGQEAWRHSFDDFRIETRTVSYVTGAEDSSIEADWMKFVPPEVRRYILLGVENAA